MVNKRYLLFLVKKCRAMISEETAIVTASYRGERLLGIIPKSYEGDINSWIVGDREWRHHCYYIIDFNTGKLLKERVPIEFTATEKVLYL